MVFSIARFPFGRGTKGAIPHRRWRALTKRRFGDGAGGVYSSATRVGNVYATRMRTHSAAWLALAVGLPAGVALACVSHGNAPLVAPAPCRAVSAGVAPTPTSVSKVTKRPPDDFVRWPFAPKAPLPMGKPWRPENNTTEPRSAAAYLGDVQLRE